MANTDNINVGGKGLAYFAPLGSTMPTDPTSAWDAAFEDAGIILSDGLAEAIVENETTFMGWGIPSPVRIEPKDRTVTWHMVLTEVSARVVSLYYSVPITDMISHGAAPNQFMEINDPALNSALYVAMGVDIVDRQTGRQYRYVAPRVRVTARDNIDYKSDALLQYGMTYTAMAPVTGGSPIKRFITNLPMPS